MDKILSVNQNQPKTKKKQPLKVVYITNPIKFQTSASEFMALVQELTGQDSEIPLSGEYWYPADEGGSHHLEKAAKVHTLDEVRGIGHVNGEVVQKGSDLSDFGSSYEDVFYNPQMMDSFQGLVGCYEAASHIDVLNTM